MSKSKGIPTIGFMWTHGGFTRCHGLNVSVTGGITMAVGTAAATVAVLGVVWLPENIFWRCVAISGCASLICIALFLASILSLTFYYGAIKLNLTNESAGTTEPVSTGDVATRAASKK